MPQNKIERTVMCCDVCDEPLHARVVSQIVERAGRKMTRLQKEFFCPKCASTKNPIKQFMKQRHEKKENFKN